MIDRQDVAAPNLSLRKQEGSSVYSFMGFLILGIIAIVIVFFFPWGEMLKGGQNPELVAANQALSKKDLDKALKLFDKYIATNPGDSAGYIGRSRVYLQMGNLDKANEDSSAALAKNPSAQAFGQQAIIFKIKGHPHEALKDFSEAIKLNPKYAWAYAQRADLYSRAQENDKALKDINKALELNPGFVEGYRMRAWILSRMGKCKDAYNDFQRIAKMGANDAWTIQDTAWFLLTCPDEKLQDTTKAMDLAKKALDMMGAKDGVFQETIAEAYFKQGDPLKAVEHQKKAIEMGSKKCPDESCVKEMKERLNKYELAARQEVRKAYEILPLDSVN
ncbi:MAG: tetratricopeptide repeat protein [Desulfomonilaceae bacterium]